MRVAVLTISDTVSKGEREDLSGPAVIAFCRGLGWEVTSSLRLPDEPGLIREHLRELADSGRVDLVVTTGGTGIGPRDNTPEATQAVADRVIPGIAEEMRAVVAARAKTLIVNVPGGPKGAVESLEAVAHLLPHAVHVLHGARHD